VLRFNNPCTFIERRGNLTAESVETTDSPEHPPPLAGGISGTDQKKSKRSAKHCLFIKIKEKQLQHTVL
jgi:hypothetical protein